MDVDRETHDLKKYLKKTTVLSLEEKIAPSATENTSKEIDLEAKPENDDAEVEQLGKATRDALKEKARKLKGKKKVDDFFEEQWKTFRFFAQAQAVAAQQAAAAMH
ncbi:unnamed protein product, partial [Mesorhabditis belari]|uniref:Uncharacterized protein n=1 Tax=Mesorhabditis belari TaxID=2138241 RepID=A0AAF3EHZ0_9BILA